MIILHNKHSKESRAFVEKHGADAEQVIDWFAEDFNANDYLRSGKPAPAQFPMVASLYVPSILIVPETDNPASELEDAEEACFDELLAEYGSEGYGTSWAELVRTIFSLKKSRESVCVAIKAEAQRRILEVWNAATIEDSQVRQTNAIRADIAAGTTDERFTKTDAIRTASNNFETALADMDKEALAALVVREWKGWPGSEEEPEVTGNGE